MTRPSPAAGEGREARSRDPACDAPIGAGQESATHAEPHRTGQADPRSQSLVARVSAWFFKTFVGRCVERILELRPFDRALALASRSFVALIPLGLVAQS